MSLRPLISARYFYVCFVFSVALFSQKIHAESQKDVLTVMDFGREAFDFLAKEPHEYCFDSNGKVLPERCAIEAQKCEAHGKFLPDVIGEQTIEFSRQLDQLPIKNQPVSYFVSGTTSSQIAQKRSENRVTIQGVPVGAKVVFFIKAGDNFQLLGQTKYSASPVVLPNIQVGGHYVRFEIDPASDPDLTKENFAIQVLGSQIGYIGRNNPIQTVLSSGDFEVQLLGGAIPFNFNFRSQIEGAERVNGHPIQVVRLKITKDTTPCGAIDVFVDPDNKITFNNYVGWPKANQQLSIHPTFFLGCQRLENSIHPVVIQKIDSLIVENSSGLKMDLSKEVELKNRTFFKILPDSLVKWKKEAKGFNNFSVTFKGECGRLKTQSLKKLIPILAAPEAGAKILGHLEIRTEANNSSNKNYHFSYVPAGSTEHQSFSPNYVNGDCGGENMFLHASLEKRGPWNRLAAGPWGNLGWIQWPSQQIWFGNYLDGKVVNLLKVENDKAFLQEVPANDDDREIEKDPKIQPKVFTVQLKKLYDEKENLLLKPFCEKGE